MGQLIVTAVVVFAVWMAFRSLSRFNQDREALRKSTEAQRQAAEAKTRPVESMRECPVCHTFRPQSRQGGCGRADCPSGPARA